VESISLVSNATGLANASAHCFSTRAEKPSGPVAFSSARAFNHFLADRVQIRKNALTLKLDTA
jgi:hypothetical protein